MSYLFIDEFGDSKFFGKRKKLLVGPSGYQPVLGIGFVRMENRRVIRKQVENFQNSIIADELYNSIPSLNKNTRWFLHAKDDHPEIRAKFFELIRVLDGIDVQIVIARKKLDVFTNKHNSNDSEFYFDVLNRLLKNQIKPTDSLYLAERQKTTMPKFITAIEKSVEKETSKLEGCKFNIVSSREFPEMSIIDYILWAVQRYIVKNEYRFFKSVSSKCSKVVDLYDSRGMKIYTENPRFP